MLSTWSPPPSCIYRRWVPLCSKGTLWGFSRRPYSKSTVCMLSLSLRSRIFSLLSQEGEQGLAAARCIVLLVCMLEVQSRLQSWQRTARTRWAPGQIGRSGPAAAAMKFFADGVRSPGVSVLLGPAGESQEEKHLGAPGLRLDHEEFGSRHLSHRPQSWRTPHLSPTAESHSA